MSAVQIIPVLNDHYVYIAPLGDKVAIIDCGEAAPVIKALERENITPDYLLITHHHHDHTNGIKAIKERYPQIEVIGPAAEAHKIPMLDKTVSEGDELALGGINIRIFDTPGHTLGHICYAAEIDGHTALFSGDTLFSMGCGRLFEGTPAQMWDSLQKLVTLPDDTLIYCGHEYTQANGRFCLSIEPENETLAERIEDVDTLRATGRPSIPVSLATEKQTNCFLRAKSAEEFARRRHLKDQA